MSVTVDWFDPEQSILIFRFVQPWDWAEYYKALDQSIDMMHQSDLPRMDIIVDFTQAGRLPANALSHFRSATKREKNRGRLTVIVGASSLLETLMKVMMTLYRKQPTPDAPSAVLAPTVDKAYAIIQDKRAYWASLPVVASA